MYKLFSISLLGIFFIVSIAQLITGDAVSLYSIFMLILAIGMYVVEGMDDISKKLDKDNR